MNSKRYFVIDLGFRTIKQTNNDTHRLRHTVNVPKTVPLSCIQTYN